MSNPSTAGASSPNDMPTAITADRYNNLGMDDRIRFRSKFARPVDSSGRPVVASDEYVDAIRKFRAEEAGGGTGDVRIPSMFNRLDFIAFLLIFAIFALLAKTQHNVNIFPTIWHYIKPDYDDGVTDYWSWDTSDAGQGTSAEL